MKLLEFNWDPPARQLRQFGVISFFALPFVGWVWGATNNTLAVMALVGLLIAAVGLISPQLIRPLFVTLMCVAAPIGLLVSELAMIMIFFGLLFPIGLVFRLLKRDALNLKIDRDSNSHWNVKKQPPNVASYYRQS